MKNSLLMITCLGLWAAQPSAKAQIAARPGANQADAGPPGGSEPVLVVGVPAADGAYSAGIAALKPATPPLYAWTTDTHDSVSPVSVVTFKTPNQQLLDETAEDLNILSLVFSQNLERALGEGGQPGAFRLGIPMLLQTGGRSVESSYVEGFGALFNLKVRFPLVPPEHAGKDSQTNSADSEWQQARRAVTHCYPCHGPDGKGGLESEAQRSTADEKARWYNPELLETLKKRTLELLRNASNLRHVQPDECIAVTFLGPPNALPQQSGSFGTPLGACPVTGSRGLAMGKGTGSAQSTSIPKAIPDVPAASAAGGENDPTRNQAAASQAVDRLTFMTIRVKKSDADALAAKKMSEDEFFHSAEINSYLGPAVVRDAANFYGRIRRP